MADETPDIDELLPEDDALFLKDKYPNHEVYQIGDEVHVLLKAFDFPAAYTPRQAAVLLRLPATYPDAAPDMFWTQPNITLTSGANPHQCSHFEVPGAGKGVEIYKDTKWQRWSRHFEGGWIVGRHGLRFFVASIKKDLERGI